MESRLLFRAAPCSFSHISSPRPASMLARSTTRSLPLLPSQHQQRRHKLTAARTKRALNIPPHPSFLEDGDSKNRIIFNPPSSQTSVYHTPFKFLPKNDPRRRENLGALFNSSTTIKYAGSSGRSSEADATAATPELPPLVPKFEPKAELQHTVSEADVAEMRRLRAENPVKWSVTELARKFNTTKMFVMIAAGSKHITEHRKKMAEEAESVRKGWSTLRTKAREDRRKRREMLYRGEL